MKEWAFLNWLRMTDRSDVPIPIGDDAAALALPLAGPLLWALDTIVEGTHFLADAAPERIGHKALAVNLSDLAAMGGRPLGALLGLTLPVGAPEELPRRLVAGLRALGERTGCPLLGGDTVSHRGGLSLSVTVLGVPCGVAPIRRSGAQPGDWLVLSGAIGGSIHGRHLDVQPRLAEARRLAELRVPSAMIDVSDGLWVDAHRLADASAVDFDIDLAAVPVHPDARGASALVAGAHGEDFELLWAVPDHALAGLRAGWDLETRWHIIGRCTAPGSGRRLKTQEGMWSEAPRAGYEHG